MAGIKTMQHQSCAIKLDKLWNEWMKLKKNAKPINDGGNKRAEFTKKLDNLFDIGAFDAIEAIRKNHIL